MAPREIFTGFFTQLRTIVRAQLDADGYNVDVNRNTGVELSMGEVRNLGVEFVLFTPNVTTSGATDGEAGLLGQCLDEERQAWAVEFSVAVFDENADPSGIGWATVADRAMAIYSSVSTAVANDRSVGGTVGWATTRWQEMQQLMPDNEDDFVGCAVEVVGTVTFEGYVAV